MRVMYKDSNGSIGTVHDDSNTKNVKSKVIVIWDYGKDGKGNSITASSGFSNYDQLIEISEEHYQEYINCRAWSKEQKDVRVKILGTAEINERKKCRDCDYWGADPDDEYCGHPKAVEISPVGISLSRGRGNIASKPRKPEDDLAFGICGPEGKLWEPRHESRKLTRRS